MGKPKAPAPPDYAAAATAQGTANTNSAIATNFLNQANQVGPDGNLTYSYDSSKGYRLPDGTLIPQTTATTTLSPDQQKLYDQNNGLSISLNDLAAKGIGYVDQASSHPIDQSQLPGMRTAPGSSQFRTSAGTDDYTAQRDRITNAMMGRLQPQLDRQQNAMENKLTNQGITQGSEAWKSAQDDFGRNVNDQRTSALLAGDQEQQSLWDQQQRAFTNYNGAQEAQFNQGLAGGQFDNQARSQAIQEADYFKNQPLNMLNALRSGNQVSMPTFGNVSAGSNIAAAPVYAATNDAYQGALQQYQAKMASYGAILGGIGKIGGAAIGKWG